MRQWPVIIKCGTRGRASGIRVRRTSGASGFASGKARSASGGCRRRLPKGLSDPQAGADARSPSAPTAGIFSSRGQLPDLNGSPRRGGGAQRHHGQPDGRRSSPAEVIVGTAAFARPTVRSRSPHRPRIRGKERGPRSFLNPTDAGETLKLWDWAAGRGVGAPGCHAPTSREDSSTARTGGRRCHPPMRTMAGSPRGDGGRSIRRTLDAKIRYDRTQQNAT